MANSLFIRLRTSKWFSFLLASVALIVSQDVFAQLPNKERKERNAEAENLCQNPSNEEEIIRISSEFFENGKHRHFKSYECYFQALKGQGRINDFFSVWNEVADKFWFRRKYYDASESIYLHYKRYTEELDKATKAMQEKELEKALEHLDDCEDLDGKVSSAVENKALVLYDLGRYSECIPYSRKAIELSILEFKPQGHFQHILASSFLELNEPDSAYKYAVPAQASLKDSVEPNITLAKTLLSLGKVDSALHVSTEALSIDEDNADLHFMHAIALRHNSKFFGAAFYLGNAERLGMQGTNELLLEYLYNYNAMRYGKPLVEKSNLYIAANPSLPLGYYYRGLAHKNKYPRDYERAYQDFGKAAELDSSTSEYISKKAWCAYRSNRAFPEVINGFTKAIQLDSTIFFNWYWRTAITYRDMDQHYKAHDMARECLTYYKRQIRLHPTKAVYYHSASECIEMLGWGSVINKPYKGLRLHYMRKCVELDSTNRQYYFDLAVYCYTQKMYDSCIWMIENGKRFKYWTSYSHYLGNCYEKKGDLIKAEAIFSEAVERHPKWYTVYDTRADFYLRTNQRKKYEADIKMRDSLK